MKFRARVSVQLKPEVLDAEGKNVKKSLDLLDLPVDDVSFVKTYEITLERDDLESARAAIEEACHRLLANPVVHDYQVTVEPLA